jgi:hypothetical protein
MGEEEKQKEEEVEKEEVKEEEVQQEPNYKNMYYAQERKMNDYVQDASSRSQALEEEVRTMRKELEASRTGSSTYNDKVYREKWEEDPAGAIQYLMQHSTETIKETVLKETTAQIAQEKARTDVMKQYPELEDPTSEFYRDTMREFGDSYLDLANNPKGVLLAAYAAYAKNPKYAKRRHVEATKEGEKIRREKVSKHFVEGATADNSNLVPSSEEVDLTPQQKAFAEEFGISEENYKKRLNPDHLFLLQREKNRRGR